jgi:hypothetical protein
MVRDTGAPPPPTCEFLPQLARDTCAVGFGLPGHGQSAFPVEQPVQVIQNGLLILIEFKIKWHVTTPWAGQAAVLR